MAPAACSSCCNHDSRPPRPAPRCAGSSVSQSCSAGPRPHTRRPTRGGVGRARPGQSPSAAAPRRPQWRALRPRGAAPARRLGEGGSPHPIPYRSPAPSPKELTQPPARAHLRRGPALPGALGHRGRPQPPRPFSRGPPHRMCGGSSLARSSGGAPFGERRDSARLPSANTSATRPTARRSTAEHPAPAPTDQPLTLSSPALKLNSGGQCCPLGSRIPGLRSSSKNGCAHTCGGPAGHLTGERRRLTGCGGESRLLERGEQNDNNER